MTNPAITPRAILIIDHIAHGDPRHAIAAQLGISEGTVCRDANRARKHLGARNEAHLVDLAIRRRLITIPPGTPAAMERYLITTLQLIAAGYSNADLAAHLFMSVEGVKSRVADIRRRLAAVDRAHAVTVGWRRGLLHHHAHNLQPIKQPA